MSQAQGCEPSASSADKTKVKLGGVPETLLWTLYNRAVEARRPDRVLDDPLAVELLDRIDYPFETTFGRPTWSQAQALRARRFDDEVRSYIAGHPGCTVVSLGEGLETQFWRLDDGAVRWLTVDLPEVVTLRERLLPGSPRLRAVGMSALDERWMDEVDPSAGVIITAQGLFMYLDLEDVKHLIEACGRRFPGGALIFDAIPEWLSRTTTSDEAAVSRGYTVPPMLWGMDADAAQAVWGAVPGIAEVSVLSLPRGRGAFFGALLPMLHLIPPIRDKRLPMFPWVMIAARFSGVVGAAPDHRKDATHA